MKEDHAERATDGKNLRPKRKKQLNKAEKRWQEYLQKFEETPSDDEIRERLQSLARHLKQLNLIGSGSKVDHYMKQRAAPNN